MTTKPTIGIIGGGFCGTATFIQLIKQTKGPLNIVLINKTKPHTKGIAFNSYNPDHVLNVPAVKMSLFPDEPENFVEWIKSKTEYSNFVDDELNDKFLPRQIYGRYLEELFNETIYNLPENVSINVLEDEAVDLIPSESSMKVVLKKNKSFNADRVVLALGNFIPENPKIKNERFYESKNYFQDPWKIDVIKNLDEINDILIIGTGLTMVDNVISLLQHGYKGKIYALSTKGFFPLSHKKRKPYTEILDDLKPPYSISKLYVTFRKHIKHVLSNGITGEAVVDAVRPKTQEIWLSLSLDDKKRFMNHIRHLWGVARHRLPKEIFDNMQTLMKDGRLEILGGRILNIEEKDNKIIVSYKDRKNQQVKEVKVQRVINCTGPKTDLNKVDDELVKNLMSRGIVAADEMKLGINALPDGTIIQKDHSLSTRVFTLGSMLKGILWESTAVPELRSQAKNLASHLLDQLEVKDKVKI